MNFTNEIANWYHINKRDLPWRNTNNAYHIWLSEVILQQTRVEQGLPYYYKFVTHYPTVESLADASEDEVLKHWQGLGYYSRARNMLATARQVVAEHKGVFPKEYADVLKLKGIGPYTAAAIVSFAYNEPFPVVDGNVYRVLARFFGIATPIDSTQGKKEFLELAESLMDRDNPALFNQAMMEFGALQCKPASPNCGICPLSIACYAQKEAVVGELPVKSKKMKPRDRHFHYFVLETADGGFWMNKRSDKDIWANMFDFPLLETDIAIEFSVLQKSPNWKALWGIQAPEMQHISQVFKHQLTHQTIYATFYACSLPEINKKWEKHFIQVDAEMLHKYALPRLIDKYLLSRKEAEQITLTLN